MDGAASDVVGAQDRHVREQRSGAGGLRQHGQPRVRQEAGGARAPTSNARVTKKPRLGVTTLNSIGATPFLLAARTADAELMRLLVELGADPLLPNEDNTTPLMVAAGVGTQSPGEDPGTEPEVLEAVRWRWSSATTQRRRQERRDRDARRRLQARAAVVRFLAERAPRSRSGIRRTRGRTPLKIAEGIQRGMNFVSSPPTAAAIREVMAAATVTPPR